MKNYGKVKEYNGVYGEIEGQDGKSYTLLDKNIISESVEKSDEVEFETEAYKTSEIEMNIAEHVRVLKKDTQKKVD